MWVVENHVRGWYEMAVAEHGSCFSGHGLSTSRKDERNDDESSLFVIPYGRTERLERHRSRVSLLSHPASLLTRKTKLTAMRTLVAAFSTKWIPRSSDFASGSVPWVTLHRHRRRRRLLLWLLHCLHVFAAAPDSYHPCHQRLPL